jgi:hypothetical protein
LLEQRPIDDLLAGELEGADAETEREPRIKGKVRGLGKFKAALQVGEAVLFQLYSDEITQRQSPMLGYFLVEIRAGITGEDRGLWTVRK